MHMQNPGHNASLIIHALLAAFPILCHDILASYKIRRNRLLRLWFQCSKDLGCVDTSGLKQLLASCRCPLSRRPLQRLCFECLRNSYEALTGDLGRRNDGRIPSSF